MTIQRIDSDEATSRALGILGLDSALVDLFSREGVCASLRRAASYLCPASPRKLVDAVLDVLKPLDPDVDRDEVAQALDALIGAGDLLELSASDGRARMLFLGPPTFVERQLGQYLLLGVRANGAPLIDEDSLGADLTYEGHTRSIVMASDVATETFAVAGLHRMTAEQWARAPRADSASSVVEKTLDRMRATGAAGQVAGLTVIDPTASVRYYKGRWREPAGRDQGTFVGRRPQAYGAPIWCVVNMLDGAPQALLDLPLDSSNAPGWDDGLRLQAALDAERGSPQQVRSRRAGQRDEDWIFDFFGPLPSWAERYLDLAGLPVSRSQGALFSYRVSDGAKTRTLAFLSSKLWMQATEEERNR